MSIFCSRINILNKLVLQQNKYMQNNKTNNCPLCGNPGVEFYRFNKRLYFQCTNCSGIFVDKKLRPDYTTEKLRYEKHVNNINDEGYQKFVSPITNAILQDFSPSKRGLDFGAGTGSVISKLLTDENFSIELYDPFFHNYPELLDNRYDYIACCEVMEHFYKPKKEFELLLKLLLPDGKLYCMTSLWNENIDFHSWYYKNDVTHVFIYHNNTIQWIKENIGFSRVTIDGSLIIFSY